MTPLPLRSFLSLFPFLSTSLLHHHHLSLYRLWGILLPDLLLLLTYYYCSTHRRYHHNHRHPTSLAPLPSAFFSSCLGHKVLRLLTPMSTHKPACEALALVISFLPEIAPTTPVPYNLVKYTISRQPCNLRI